MDVLEQHGDMAPNYRRFEHPGCAVDVAPLASRDRQVEGVDRQAVIGNSNGCLGSWAVIGKPNGCLGSWTGLGPSCGRPRPSWGRQAVIGKPYGAGEA